MTVTSDRLTRSPWQLLRQTAGGPRDWLRKTVRFWRAVWRWVRGRVLRERLARLHARGLVEELPNKVQLFVGSMDMLRFWISPAAADYYRSQGISYGFHQLLRILDDPASMIDPLGLFSERDTVIGHVLQVVHANPCYDLQLLEAYEDGVDQLEAQTRAMIDGTHPRARSIGAICEDPDYHPRLLDYIRRYRLDPCAPAPIRDNVASDPALQVLERTFGTLPAAFRYFRRMPDGWWAGLGHLRRARTFPVALAEPAPGIEPAP